MRGVFAALALACLATAPVQAFTPDPMARARQLLETARPGGKPFAVVDKRAAQLIVFHPDGTLAGATPVLLGSAPGDHATAGVGQRAQDDTLQPADKTTPAGRFHSEPGRNLQGEHVVWLDYEAALSIHRLRPGPSMPERARRLATPTLSDNRVSAGCVVVPPAFYAEVVRPVLGRTRGVVHILPEREDDAAM